MDYMVPRPYVRALVPPVMLVVAVVLTLTAFLPLPLGLALAIMSGFVAVDNLRGLRHQRLLHERQQAAIAARADADQATLDRAAWDALTDDDRAELERLGADLDGIRPATGTAVTVGPAWQLAPASDSDTYRCERCDVDVHRDRIYHDQVCRERRGDQQGDWIDLTDRDGSGLVMCAHCRWVAPVGSREMHTRYCPARAGVRTVQLCGTCRLGPCRCPKTHRCRHCRQRVAGWSTLDHYCDGSTEPRVARDLDEVAVEVIPTGMVQTIGRDGTVSLTPQLTALEQAQADENDARRRADRALGRHIRALDHHDRQALSAARVPLPDIAPARPVPQEVAVPTGTLQARPMAEGGPIRPNLAFRRIRLSPIPDEDVEWFTCSASKVIIMMKNGERHEIDRTL
jgi:hypothetical protein